MPSINASGENCNNGGYVGEKSKTIGRYTLGFTDIQSQPLNSEEAEKIPDIIKEYIRRKNGDTNGVVVIGFQPTGGNTYRIYSLSSVKEKTE